MRKRSQILALVGLAAFVGLTTFVGRRLFIAPAHRINENNSWQIQNGMTREQVEAILGVPAGNYATREDLRRMPLSAAWRMPRQNGEVYEWKTWVSDETAVAVCFRPDGIAAHVEHFEVGVREPESLPDRIRRWLGW